MGHSNGKITAPVGIDADIAPVLGVGSYDLGYLCSNAHGKINKWSKIKPVKYATLAELTAAQLKSVAYGMTYTIDTAWNVIWAYEPPTGGDSAPFRALDFNGYNHNAVTGMAFEQGSYSYDLIRGSSDGINVGLHTDPSLITVLDFVDTLFKDCKIRLQATSYGNTVEYTYQSPLETITENSTLHWNLSTTVLQNFNVGTVSLVTVIVNPEGRQFMPLVKNQVLLSISANTGVTLPNWGYNMKIGTTVDDATNAYYYQMGGGTKVMDLSNGKNFFLLFYNIINNSGQTIGYDSVFIHFSWKDDNNQEHQERASLRMGTNLTTWSLSSGGTLNYQFGCKSAEIPVISSDGAERNVRIVPQVKLTQNGVPRYYNIASPLQLRMKKSQ